MIVMVPLAPILIILLFFALGIIGNADAIMDNVFFFVALISTILNIIICFYKAILQEKMSFISQIRKVVSCIFCIVMPIVIIGLFLQSNNYYGEMSNSWNGYTFVYKYQKSIALVVNLLVVIIMLLLPICGEKIVNHINLTRCNNSSYKEACIVQKDGFVFQAIRTNYEKSVGNNSVISLPFFKCEVKKGDSLFATGKTFEENGKTYIEVYDDTIYGFIDEKCVNKKDSKSKKK